MTALPSQPQAVAASGRSERGRLRDRLARPSRRRTSATTIVHDFAHLDIAEGPPDTASDSRHQQTCPRALRQLCPSVCSKRRRLARHSSLPMCPAIAAAPPDAPACKSDIPNRPPPSQVLSYVSRPRLRYPSEQSILDLAKTTAPTQQRAPPVTSYTENNSIAALETKAACQLGLVGA